MGLINLQKGQLLDLSKYDGLRKVRVGLGWDMANEDEPKADLDLSFFAFRNGKMQSPQDLVFFNNRFGVNGIQGSVDNRDGAGEGDDEVIIVDLNSVPSDVNKLVFVATIFEADVRQQTFGMVNNSFMRVVDDATNNEIARFELKDDFSTETSVILGELVKENSSWLFHTIGEGKKADLNGLYSLYM